MLQGDQNVLYQEMFSDTADVMMSYMLAELQRAQSIFDLSRAGIEFVGDTFIGVRPNLTVDEGLTINVSRCDDLTYMAGKLPRMDVDAKVIYVVYAQRLYVPQDGDGPDKTVTGKSCFPTEDRAAGLVLINWYEADVTSLAHELGHYMGLRRGAVYNYGHTRPLDGFDHSNVMWGTNDFDKPGVHERFSVGQVYRMVSDCRSWLFYVGRAPPKRCCQFDPYTSAPCPPAFLDLTEVPPVTEGPLDYNDPACPCEVF